MFDAVGRGVRLILHDDGVAIAVRENDPAIVGSISRVVIPRNAYVGRVVAGANKQGIVATIVVDRVVARREYVGVVAASSRDVVIPFASVENVVGPGIMSRWRQAIVARSTDSSD